ncbi:MAG: carbohydrate ABC transporter permease [Lachnospiraceae bacterium]|nr:carbohydrate ABC transporter permease [Lachnospiraceae bacterium]
MTSKKKKSLLRYSLGDSVFLAIVYLLLLFSFLIILYPILYVISASFSDPNAVAGGEMILWPINPSLQAYEYILHYGDIWTGYANTIFYTVAGTLLNLLFTLPCAYMLSRRDVVGRGIIMTLFVITMYFGGGLIPTYLNLNELGMINTRWSLLLPGVVSAYNLIVARTFFVNTIPWELQEAAFLDGCSDFRMFTKIILPLSSPIIVVMTLYYGVGHWNAYFNAMIYIRDRELYPLQVFLREILTMGQFASDAMQNGGDLSPEEMLALAKQTETANMIKYAVIVVSTAPMLIVYPFLQKYFAKGVMIGSVKG